MRLTHRNSNCSSCVWKKTNIDGIPVSLGFNLPDGVYEVNVDSLLVRESLPALLLFFVEDNKGKVVYGTPIILMSTDRQCMNPNDYSKLTEFRASISHDNILILMDRVINNVITMKNGWERRTND